MFQLQFSSSSYPINANRYLCYSQNPKVTCTSLLRVVNTLNRFQIPGIWQTTGEIKGAGQGSSFKDVLKELTVSNNANTSGFKFKLYI